MPFNQAPQLSLHFFENDIYCHHHGNDQVKCIDRSDLALLIQDMKIKTPVTPIEPGVLAMGSEDNGRTLIQVVYEPPHKGVLHLQCPNIQSFDFWFPNLLFVVKRTQGSFQSELKVFTFLGLLDSKTTLYIPPLFNLYGDGSMCFGTIQLEPASTARRFIEQTFFNSMFTQHTSFTHPKVEAQGDLATYLKHHADTGWDFQDLEPFGSYQDLLEEL